MADNRSVSWLLEGVQAWNARREDLGTRFLNPDLSDVNLYWAFRDAEKLDGRGKIPLAKADLSGALLSGTDCTFADLSDSDLTQAVAPRATLVHADLSHARLVSANFENATLADSDLTRADFSNGVLTDADLSRTTLNHTCFVGCSLAGTFLAGSKPWRALFYPEADRLDGENTHTREPVTSVSDLMGTIKQLNAKSPIYFRGEPALGLRLSPSVVRCDLTEWEGDMLRDLISRRPDEFSGMTTTLDQWVLARHHGLKTRFLDVTKNPLVGLFFACEPNGNDGKRAACLHIFGIPEHLKKTFDSDTISVIANLARLPQEDKNLLLHTLTGPVTHQVSERSRYGTVMKHLYQLLRREKSYFEERIDMKDFYGVFVVEPQQSSDRVRSQSGAFLLSAFREQFDFPEGTDWNGGVRPYNHHILKIDGHAKENILEELRMLNVTRQTLFPGLDSTAEVITDLYRQRLAESAE